MNRITLQIQLRGFVVEYFFLTNFYQFRKRTPGQLRLPVLLSFLSVQVINRIRLLILYVTHTDFKHINSVIFKKYGYTVLYIMNYRCGEIKER